MPKFQEVEIDHNYLDSLLITDIVINKTWPIVALNEVFRWLFKKDTERLTKRKIRGKLPVKPKGNFFLVLPVK